MQCGFAAVQPLHELHNPAVVAVHFLPTIPLVGEFDSQALVEESQFPEPAGQRFKVHAQLAKNFRVRLEGNACTSTPADTDLPHLADGYAPLVVLLEHLTVAANLHFQPFAQGIHCLDADAMQACGHGVNILFELSPGANLTHHQFERVAALCRMHADRNAPSVIGDGYTAVHADLDVDVFAIASHGLVHAVVHQLIDEVVQTTRPDVADVHTGIGADVRSVFEHLNVGSGVATISSVQLLLTVRVFCHTSRTRRPLRIQRRILHTRRRSAFLHRKRFRIVQSHPFFVHGSPAQKVCRIRVAGSIPTGRFQQATTRCVPGLSSREPWAYSGNRTATVAVPVSPAEIASALPGPAPVLPAIVPAAAPPQTVPVGAATRHRKQ
jgi:hypothetical protein